MVRPLNIEKLSSYILVLELISSSEELDVVGKPLITHKNEKKMNEINMFILNNFHRSIDLKEIAIFVGMPQSSFCVFFKKMMVRLPRACPLKMPFYTVGCPLFKLFLYICLCASWLKS